MSSRSFFLSDPFPRSSSILILPLVITMFSSPTSGLDIVSPPFLSLIRADNSLTDKLILTRFIILEVTI